MTPQCKQAKKKNKTRLYCVFSKTMTKKLNDKIDPHILFGSLALLMCSKKQFRKHFALLFWNLSIKINKA